MKDVDWGLTAADYGRFRIGFPDSLYDRLVATGVGLPGQRILDLGTGTGAMARAFARRGCVATGLDRSAAILAEGARLAREEGLLVRWVAGRAEEPGLASASFDAVVAGQCWHWFDRPRAAQEGMRLLVPAGRLAICHFDWLPLPGNVVEATEELVVRHNPAWDHGGGNGLYPQWLPDLSAVGYLSIASFHYDVDVPYTHEGWRGRIRASAGVSASLPPEAVERFDADHALLLARRFPAQLLAVPHRIWVALARAPA
ncbi:MAG: methyltransferase domain-containing protein [Planctomycetes bacterium]|nr:methyltransferase domain-containing protein [Planctomycetota bacterium]